MEYKYEGIILGKRDIGEVDRIYTIFTSEKGKIRVLGKGVRKPNAKLAGGLETITGVEVFIAKNRGMGKITGIIVSDNFSNIKHDLDILIDVFYVFRVLGQIIPEEEADSEVFTLLKNYLHILNSLNKKNIAPDIITVGLLFKVMDRLGYCLEVNRCVQCEKKLVLEKNYLSMSHGGISCSDCYSNEIGKTAISNELIKLIRIFLKNKLENLGRVKIDANDANKLKTIIRDVVSWFSGEPFRI